LPTRSTTTIPVARFATLEEALFHQCLKVIDVLDKLDEVDTADEHSKSTRAKATKIVRADHRLAT
jgi:hypothetical protein